MNAGAWVNYAYDPNGNLTSEGSNSYTWDRANRMHSIGTTRYVYDGFGNRIQQNVGVTVTKYLLDLQPGLAVVLAETTGANTVRYVHAPRGIHAHKDATNNWEWPLQDGLGSVRGVASNTAAVLESRNYEPFGTAFGTTGTSQTPYGFTGEPTDGNGLVYLRARYYSPALGVFPSRDPFEGMAERAMSLNGYSWVEGNVVNAVDPSGRCVVPTGVCLASLAFVLDNALGIGFPIDGAACAWAIGCLGVAGFIAAVSAQFGTEVANSIADTLGANAASTGTGQTHQTEFSSLSTLSDLELCALLNSGVCQPNMSLAAPPMSGVMSYPSSVYVLPDGTIITLGSNIGSAHVHTYKLGGFDEKVGTLAEHLAKLLGPDYGPVAGYSYNVPNPNRDPDGGWCRTIRRIIQEIDDAGYSERQLTRDLEAAGFGGQKWLEMISALLQVIDRGLCDDHWGDFSGGSLVGG